MSEIQKLGSDSVTQRDIYFLDINKPCEIPIEFHLSSPNFACLIAWDSLNATVEEISSVVEPLIKNGGSYFCTWGPDCERVHDIIDEIGRMTHSDLGSPEGSVIMTTWHKDEPIQEALYFFLCCSWPDGHYEGSTNSSLAIVIGNTEWAEEIKKSLRAPRQFINIVLESEE
jgi:hypothetical protein